MRKTEYDELQREQMRLMTQFQNEAWRRTERGGKVKSGNSSEGGITPLRPGQTFPDPPKATQLHQYCRNVHKNYPGCLKLTLFNLSATICYHKK